MATIRGGESATDRIGGCRDGRVPAAVGLLLSGPRCVVQEEEAMIQDFIESLFESAPFLDFRVQGMGFFGSILYLSAIVFAFSRNTYYKGNQKK
jgi:hypothetical protein